MATSKFGKKVLGNIQHIVAVTSCKGGVGKSTVSFELAHSLAALGHKVGLFDADVHGPSLPAQLEPSVSARGINVAEDGRSVFPLIHNGVAHMSFGWLVDLMSKKWSDSVVDWTADEVRADGEIDIRGAGDAAALSIQLLHTTAWGEIDFLVVDTPPGTGKIPRALLARAHLSGALVVTTPSTLATADVVRGVDMLNRFGVPVVAIVENMSSFTCGECGKEHFPFGRGRVQEVIASIRANGAPDDTNADFHVPSFHLPITHNDTASLRTRMRDIASMTATELCRGNANKEGGVSLPQLSWDELPHWHDKCFFASRGGKTRLEKDKGLQVTFTRE